MNNTRNEKIFGLLQTVATDVETVTRSKHAAALVHKNTILAIVSNRGITHPFQKRFSMQAEDAVGRGYDHAIWIHAELDAINKAVKRHGTELVERSSLYVLRVKYADNKCSKIVRAMSKPCEHGCQQAIAAFGI